MPSLQWKLAKIEIEIERIITFYIEYISFCNVYLHSDPVMKRGKENYAADIIPQMLINCKEYGCGGGDWNSIIDNNDATNNADLKQLKCLKCLVKNFSWTDSSDNFILIVNNTP